MNAMHFSEQSLATNAIVFAIAATAIWFAGTKLSRYVDIYAERTGLRKSWFRKLEASETTWHKTCEITGYVHSLKRGRKRCLKLAPP
ncbi:hypothetical protein [Roseimaritima multifibrata]|uniref:hypothetical protein n=1 Tax=Roseimaritima multifibrata TaxID=1930274 RepID=UPI00119ED9FF|nr:hypothetical protein [Roseimaritima multifibrata]